MISQFFEDLHFANATWLWGMVAIPLVWVLFFLFYNPYRPLKHLEQFIDTHLLPFLLVGKKDGKRSYVKSLVLWSFVWACLTIAFAGPRWSFREIEVLSKDQSLVILLDLSESMNAKDIKPSRLIRSRQKIEDLLNKSTGVKIGLVAFAADPHMIAPLTDDKETIRHLLPSLDTDLVYIQGSKLSAALDMAAVMLDAEPGANKAVLVISDGELEDGSALSAAKKIADKGVLIYAMGVGTAEGAILQDKEGNSIKNNGSPILSKLVKGQLEEISKIGKGKYFDSHYGEEEELILRQLSDRANAVEAGKTNRLWEEGFYFLIFPALPIFLWWFRRGSMFLIPFLIFLPLQADLHDLNKAYFMNSEEAGKAAFDDDDFKTAANDFQDPYRKGVAHYKAGDFAEAEKMFRQSSRPEVAADAGYNLGNALVQQNKLKKAVTAYENVLKKWPDHTSAKENLELVKKMLEQQKQDKKNQKDQQNQQDQKDQQDNQDQQDQENDDQEDQQDKQDKQDNENQQDKQDRQDSENQQDEQDNQDSDNLEDQQDSEQDKENSNPENDEKDDEKDSDSENDEQPADSSEDEQDDSEDEQEAGLEEDQQEGQLEKEGTTQKSQEDQEADAWLNLLNNDPKDFLKKKFYIESMKNGTKEGVDPW